MILFLIGLALGLTVGAAITVIAWALADLGIVGDWQRKWRLRKLRRARALPPATATQIARAARDNRADLSVVKRDDGET